MIVIKYHIQVVSKIKDDRQKHTKSDYFNPTDFL